MTYSNAARRRAARTETYGYQFRPTTLADFGPSVDTEYLDTSLEVVMTVNHGSTIAYVSRSCIDFDAPVEVELERWSNDGTEIMGSVTASYVPVTDEVGPELGDDWRYDLLDTPATVETDPLAQALVALWPVLEPQLPKVQPRWAVAS